MLLGYISCFVSYSQVRSHSFVQPAQLYLSIQSCFDAVTIQFRGGNVLT